MSGLPALALPARRTALVVALLAAASCAVLVVAPACVHAQEAGAASVPVDDGLYRALGGQAGIECLTAALVPRLAADERIGPFSKHATREPLDAMLALKFRKVAGGGCACTGPPLEAAHRDKDISRADFDALVEALQAAMRDQDIPFATRNRLLARLAPLRRDVVNVH